MYWDGYEPLRERLRIEYMIWNQEREKAFREWLEEHRRMVVYRLQWGTPTGPYWVPEPPGRPWWLDGYYWLVLGQMVL